MEALLKDLTPSQLVLIVLVLGWFVKQYIEEKKNKSKALEDSLQSNTKAVLELTYEVKALKEAVGVIGKLKSDIDAAHDKLRQLEK